MVVPDPAADGGNGPVPLDSLGSVESDLPTQLPEELNEFGRLFQRFLREVVNKSRDPQDSLGGLHRSGPGCAARGIADRVTVGVARILSCCNCSTNSTVSATTWTWPSS